MVWESPPRLKLEWFVYLWGDSLLQVACMYVSGFRLSEGSPRFTFLYGTQALGSGT